MSTKALSGIALVMLGTCGEDAPPAAPAGPDYTCSSVYDTNCRFTAQVSIDGGTLEDAWIEGTPEGVASYGAFRGLTGQVTVHDSLGESPVSCGFSLDLDLGTQVTDTTAVVTTVPTIQLDDACPIACAWFLPSPGTFDATRGRYSLSPFEGSWSLQLGDWAPEEPYSHEFLATVQSSSTGYGAGGAVLNAPATLLATAWQAPLDHPVGASIEASCAP